MISVTIGPSTRELNEANESWINQQINGRLHDGAAICVRVSIQEPGLNMVMATPDCGSGGGGRPPTDRELRVFELWTKQRLDTRDFRGGNLVAFLHQLSSVL
jgi:hypothetical protein